MSLGLKITSIGFGLNNTHSFDREDLGSYSLIFYRVFQTFCLWACKDFPKILLVLSHLIREFYRGLQSCVQHMATSQLRDEENRYF